MLTTSLDNTFLNKMNVHAVLLLFAIDEFMESQLTEILEITL